MARRAECHQAVEIEVRAPLGALDDVVEAGPLNLHFGFVSQNTIASFSYQRLTFDPCLPAPPTYARVRARGPKHGRAGLGARSAVEGDA